MKPEVVAFSGRPLECRAVTRATLIIIWTSFVGLGACQPKTRAEDVVTTDPTCSVTTIEGPVAADVQTALHTAGKGHGTVAAMVPATRYTQRLTRDGYLVRGWASSLVMALAAAGIGALLAALLLALWTRRPTPRWAERIGHSITREVEQLKALGKDGDALAKALVQRLDEPLAIATKKAQRLVERAIPLAKRAESATAIAHLESLESQLEGLLARIERIHLQLLVWSERQLKEEDEAVKAQVDVAIKELSSALAEVA